MLKQGDRVTFEGQPNVSGRVTRWHASYGERSAVPGYVPVLFDDVEGIGLFHVSRLAPFSIIPKP